MPGQHSDAPPKLAHGAEEAVRKRIHTKELLRSLDLLRVGHFDGGKTERREETEWRGKDKLEEKKRRLRTSKYVFG